MEHNLVFLLECDSSGGELLRYEELPNGAEPTSEYRTVSNTGSDDSVTVPVYTIPHEP